ncbi:beta-1,4-glucuronyltransferase 1 isoform X1 [Athalia rosae]|uniref:beta-1,4-glucuronyltransferase 1 isoform X1 n=1 Tax=Athalia rosae TaxID=37344 RepID=UPI002033EAED|nr:beta-1,4-glucuronyltransferase 1 isoform X1 [Athalia rosae]
MSVSCLQWEKLMRRTQYGDLASFRNRQNVIRRCELLKLGCRPWNLSLVSVIIVTFSNMLLTMLLLQSEDCDTNYTGPADDQQPETNGFTEWNLAVGTSESAVQQQPCIDARDYQQATPESDVLRMDVRLGRWDVRRLYKMFDSVVVGSQYTALSDKYLSCIATQSSVEKLHSLVQVAHYWTGPISIAVFTAGDEDFVVFQEYLSYLRKCYAPIRERVTFSVAMPKARLVNGQPKDAQLPEGLDCLKPEATLNRFVQGQSKAQTTWKTKNVYPQNHLRNLARKNCQTDYVFLTDVDIIPSSNFSDLLNEFLKNSACDKCAYVIPTYELDMRVRFPQNKTDLVRLANKGLARPFHQKVFIHNQYATNFTRWSWDVSTSRGAGDSEIVKSGKVHVSHEVTNFEFFYEPFYVARDTVPAHDERFMGYGYTRNTQVYEMYVAGYEFLVLSPIFTGHWGLQTKKGRPAWRERQNSLNRKLFEGFKKEVFARYNRDPLKMMKRPN